MRYWKIGHLKFLKAGKIKRRRRGVFMRGGLSLSAAFMHNTLNVVAEWRGLLCSLCCWLLCGGWRWRCSDFTLKIPSDIFTSMGIPFNSIEIVFSMLLFLYLQCSAGKDALILFQIQPPWWDVACTTNACSKSCSFRSLWFQMTKVYVVIDLL